MVNDMFVELHKDVMRTFDYGSLVIAACDILSASGVKNHINWYDEVEVIVDGISHRPVIDYGRCGIGFVACKSFEVA